MDLEPTPEIQNLGATPGAENQILPNTNQREASPKAGELLFFNVMPKSKKQGPMIDPVMKIQAPVSENGSHNGGAVKAFLKKFKLYVILVIVFAVGTPAVYFTAGQIAAGIYKQSAVKITKTPANQPETQSSSSPATTVSGSDFIIPSSWREKYFPNCADPKVCGDDADPDHDGLTNLSEYNLGTDPNNPDSDQDGIADGDEINVFGSDPLSSHTANDAKYSDADYIKGGYDFSGGAKMTAAQIEAINTKMKQYGLHEPTISTLGNVLNTLYYFSGLPTATSTPGSASFAPPSSGNSSTSPLSGIDNSLTAKQTRDAKRSDTIKNLEIALVAYFNSNSAYPVAADFTSMFSQVKPYLRVATNPVDPINKDPYVYSYAANASGTDFSLSFYSEVAGQIIVKNASQAAKDAALEQGNIYDNQREMDLQNLQTALLLYSNANVAGNQTYVFPTKDKYKTALVPNYISAIPKDPKTGIDYDYEVSATFNTFTLKTVLDNPPTGTTGYVCNQDSCQNY